MKNFYRNDKLISGDVVGCLVFLIEITTATYTHTPSSASQREIIEKTENKDIKYPRGRNF